MKRIVLIFLLTLLSLWTDDGAFIEVEENGIITKIVTWSNDC